ncbi:MAG TPA: hypothetical protein VIL46_04030 [Gemmataceae bacterium]
MIIAVVLVVGIGALLGGGLLALSRKRYRLRFGPGPGPAPAAAGPPASEVTRQHLHLFQGGLLSESALEARKAEMRRLLECGDLSRVETGLRPGLDYVVQVRALTEIGSEAAGQVLEKQLGRRLSADPVEQSWYWVDLARSLRQLHRAESLPRLLDCAGVALELPTGYLFAAEMVAFPGFADCLADPVSPAGPAALRVLRHALEGIRIAAVPLGLIAEAGLGERLADLAARAGTGADPRLVPVFLEALRLLRRAEHAERFVLADPLRLERLHAQYARLAAEESGLRAYLRRAAAELPRRLGGAAGGEQRDVLAAIDALRADAGGPALRLLADPHFPHRAAALGCLRWSRDPQTVPFVTGALRGAARPRRGPALGAAEKALLLRVLRHHPCDAAERELIRHAQAPEPEVREAALRGLGWWEPHYRREVLALLQRAREHGPAGSRMLAEAALGRLGERAALRRLRAALAGEDPAAGRSAIHLIAREGVSWLWPELDSLVDSEDLDTAFDACEALEQLREDLLGPLC